MYAIRSYYGSLNTKSRISQTVTTDTTPGNQKIPAVFWYQGTYRITSYNVCYTKLLRSIEGNGSSSWGAREAYTSTAARVSSNPADFSSATPGRSRRLSRPKCARNASVVAQVEGRPGASRRRARRRLPRKPRRLRHCRRPSPRSPLRRHRGASYNFV